MDHLTLVYPSVLLIECLVEMFMATPIQTLVNQGLFAMQNMSNSSAQSNSVVTTSHVLSCLTLPGDFFFLRLLHFSSLGYIGISVCVGEHTLSMQAAYLGGYCSQSGQRQSGLFSVTIFTISVVHRMVSVIQKWRMSGRQTSTQAVMIVKSSMQQNSEQVFSGTISSGVRVGEGVWRWGVWGKVGGGGVVGNAEDLSSRASQYLSDTMV